MNRKRVSSPKQTPPKDSSLEKLRLENDSLKEEIEHIINESVVDQRMNRALLSLIDAHEEKQEYLANVSNQAMVENQNMKIKNFWLNKFLRTRGHDMFDFVEYINELKINSSNEQESHQLQEVMRIFGPDIELEKRRKKQ